MTKKLQISSNKLNALLILQDVAALNGKQVSLEKLNGMNLKELFQFGKNNFETYVNALPKDRQEKIIADFEEPELISNTIDEQGNLIKDSLEKISFLFKTLFTEKINRWPKFTNSIIRAKIKNSQFKILRSETITENSRMTSSILSPKRMSHRKSLLI